MKPRRLRAGALLLLAVLVLAGCASTTSSTAVARHASQLGAKQPVATPTVTAVHVFRAYDSSGRLTVPATAGSRSGSCWTTSLAAPSRWAFRCLSGNRILDPCFARAGSTRGSVACVADPWSKAIVLHLTERLPTHTYPTDRVWAFRRTDGISCVAATGTVPEVRGRNLDYLCSDGSSAVLVHPNARLVQADYASAGAGRLHRVDVRTIWHA